MGDSVTQLYLPGEHAVSMLQILGEVSFKDSTVAVVEDTVAVHGVLDEGALVVAAVRPGVGTFTLHLVVLEGALVFESIVHLELALAMAFARLKFALKGTIRPDLSTLTLLVIVGPVALVHSAVWLDELALTATQIVHEVADVVAAVFVDDSTTAIHLVIGPVAVVSLPVRIDEAASAMAHTTAPLALIHGIVGFGSQVDLFPLHDLHVQVFKHLLARLVSVDEVTKLLQDGRNGDGLSLRARSTLHILAIDHLEAEPVVWIIRHHQHV